MAETRFELHPAMAAILVAKRNDLVSAQRELALAIDMAMIAVGCPPQANLLTVANGELVVDLPPAAE